MFKERKITLDNDVILGIWYNTIFEEVTVAFYENEQAWSEKYPIDYGEDVAISMPLNTFKKLGNLIDRITEDIK